MAAGLLGLLDGLARSVAGLVEVVFVSDHCAYNVTVSVDQTGVCFLQGFI